MKWSKSTNEVLVITTPQTLVWLNNASTWNHIGEVITIGGQSLFSGIASLIKLQLDNDQFISSNNIPVSIFEYDLEKLIENELNKLGVCVIVNFCELMDQIKNFPDNSHYTLQGKIDIYEQPDFNRSTKAGYVTGYDTAQEVMGSLTQLDLQSNNLTEMDIISIKNTSPKKSSDEDVDLVRWTLTYQIRPMISSKVYST